MKRLTLLLILPPVFGCEIENNVYNLDKGNPNHFLEEEVCEPAELAVEGDKQPVAVCSASTLATSPISGSVDFFGHESHDPNGYPIVHYRWAIVDKPEGSEAELGAGIADRYDFRPDLAGSYTVQLEVENDRCIRSEPCELTVDAVPNENLWVEMHWEHAGDDMDLHLVRNNGEYESEDDCYYGNCVSNGEIFSMLDWGIAGESIDDPSLDLDDIDNVGPENINIEEPANGLYTVVVHDFPSSVYEGSNKVTVRIHLDGE
ncbi:MAG: hypothetical protein VX278_08780, partial [Myxococcota bacterium]|nr:hypothetical protein [Myxococcota bacterium]